MTTNTSSDTSTSGAIMLAPNRNGSYFPPAALPTYARMLLLTPLAMVSRIKSPLSSLGNSGEANTASLTALVLHSLCAPDQFRTRNFGLIPSEMSPSCFRRFTMKPTRESAALECTSPRSTLRIALSFPSSMTVL